MIDNKDTQTKDAFAASRRGRPALGKAKSSAERKRHQRAKAKHAVRASIFGPASIATISLTSLHHELASAVRYGDVDVVRSISQELERRTIINRDSHD
ncbi:hypothetical protein QWI17_07365 [Gilvimarinus sp. SDUM040013]|uniref:Uncharacterized protein n=1 Tax=Gilvimarinus gilvus TaxID=3058038 RepID=A0ABU4S6L1_9GAMM|nr:hypothetical protein [Gilvimarinus sp. SDUM040013]MDO3385652.1 hypothetical protein [Gilvimarinus sp. SDUM040013]MDX6851558.1 hypothetical protein [Gilvimarinus sp. SDUM040013]